MIFRHTFNRKVTHRCFCSVTALVHRWLNMLFATAIARFTAELSLQAVRIYTVPIHFFRILTQKYPKKGADAPSTDVFLKLFGKVAEPFPEKCTVSWVTSDLERAEYYETLPYTNKMYSCRFYRSFLQLANEVQDDKYLSDIFPKPPVLLISGTEDMVGDKGEYAKEKASVLKANGFDVRLVILDGMRHSVLQEKERTDVYRLIADFISNQEHNDNL